MNLANRVLIWFMEHPIMTTLLILVGSSALEIFGVVPMNKILNLNHLFSDADLLLMGSICLIMGIYYVSTINHRNKTSLTQSQSSKLEDEKL